MPRQGEGFDGRRRIDFQRQSLRQRLQSRRRQVVALLAVKNSRKGRFARSGLFSWEGEAPAEPRAAPSAWTRNFRSGMVPQNRSIRQVVATEIEQVTVKDDSSR